jgi:hypothetical protein
MDGRVGVVAFMGGLLAMIWQSRIPSILFSIDFTS